MPICAFRIFSTLFVMVHPKNLLPFTLLLHLSSPCNRLSHRCLDVWSAGIGCAAFHLSTSFLVRTISFAHTHNLPSLCFHLAKYIGRPSIYFWSVPAFTSNSSHSSDSSSCVVLGILITQILCRPLLHVRTSTVDYHLCSPWALLHLVLSVNKSSSSGQFLCLGRVHAT